MAWLKVMLVALALSLIRIVADGAGLAAPSAECHASEARMTALQRLRHGFTEKSQWKPLPGCPGWDDEDSGYANFVLNNTTFRAKRDYLTPPQQREADGIAKAMWLHIELSALIPNLDVGSGHNENLALDAIARRTPSICQDKTCKLELHRRAMLVELRSDEADWSVQLDELLGSSLLTPTAGMVRYATTRMPRLG